MSATETSPSAPESHPPSGPFQFPIRKVDGTPFANADELHSVLEGEHSGHYLLRANGFWHGGIHITNATSPHCVRDEPLRAIADGVVVAYRLNREPLKSQIADSELEYSNSFCLIRHDYHSPVNTEEGPNQGKQNSLTFYSLYLHVSPYSAYSTKIVEADNHKIKMAVGGFSARSKWPGDTLSVKYGNIAAGAVFEILEERPSGSSVSYARGKLLSGTVENLEKNQECWFAYNNNGKPYKNDAGKDIWSTIIPPQRKNPAYWQGTVRGKVLPVGGLLLRDPPATLAHGAQAGQPKQRMALCKTSTIQFESSKVLNLTLDNKTLRMAECTFVPGNDTGLTSDRFGAMPDVFWCCVEEHFVEWGKVLPTQFDEVVFCDTAIKAGEPVGYLGAYDIITDDKGGKSSKHQVHMEVFSADERLESFLKNEAGLKQGKQYLRLPADTVLTGKTPADQNTRLTQTHVIELNKAPLFKDAQGVEWHETSVTEGGQTLTGLIRKDSPELITQHDWEKLGFQMVEEYNPDADGYLDPEDMPDFFTALYREIDSNHDGNVSPQELSSALKNVRLRDRWSKLIARHRTEWKGGSNAPLYSRFEELMADMPAALEHEKERLDKLQFWDEVAGKVGLPEDGRVWHFHPVEFAARCMLAGPITLEMLRLVNPLGSDEQHVAILPFFNKYAVLYGLLQGREIAHFLSQVAHESGLKNREENLDFKASRMKEVYGCLRRGGAQSYSPATDSCSFGVLRSKLWSNESYYAHNPKNLGNYVYANRMGNGGESSGDGYKYRGRGLIQLTGKSEYQVFNKVHNEKNPHDIKDFVMNPDLLFSSLDYCVESAFVFWFTKSGRNGKLCMIAKIGSVKEVTQIVNGGQNGFSDRESRFLSIQKKLGF